MPPSKCFTMVIYTTYIFFNLLSCDHKTFVMENWHYHVVTIFKIQITLKHLLHPEVSVLLALFKYILEGMVIIVFGW